MRTGCFSSASTRHSSRIRRSERSSWALSSRAPSAPWNGPQQYSFDMILTARSSLPHAGDSCKLATEVCTVGWWKEAAPCTMRCVLRTTSDSSTRTMPSLATGSAATASSSSPCACETSESSITLRPAAGRTNGSTCVWTEV